jgi:hypothetical protein
MLLEFIFYLTLVPLSPSPRVKGKGKVVFKRGGLRPLSFLSLPLVRGGGRGG